MIYCIYEVKNLINGKTYYGQHRLRENRPFEKDPYFGSGKILNYAIKKYGRNNFKKSIVIQGDFSKNEINSFEKCIIRMMRLIDKAEYNIADGGNGGGGSKFWSKEVKEVAYKKIAIASANYNLLHPERPKGGGHTKGTTGKTWKMPKGHQSGERNSSYGNKWWTNGIENKKSKNCPEGFWKGRVNGKTKLS
jgi:hypothetical protein